MIKLTFIAPGTLAVVLLDVKIILSQINHTLSEKITRLSLSRRF